MAFFNLIPRTGYHKNGTQFIGKFVARIIGERTYEWIRLEKRILYMSYYYKKQLTLYKLWHQYPNVATFFSLLNKADTSSGFPARRAYERHSDFAIFNINSEGWFQLYFFVAALVVMAWNWWVLGAHYDNRGVSVEDEDLYRYKDARVTCDFDRTKYNYDSYFHSTHSLHYLRQHKASRDHPDDPRVSYYIY